MFKTLMLASGVLAAGLGTVAAVPAAQPERTNKPPLNPDKIILVGDSTMAPMSGWASAFCARHVAASVACLNLGRGGRSTRSYQAEGSWDLAVREAGVPGYRGTYVLIQFGHNDAHKHLPDRWVEVETEFPANLRKFVEDVRAVGAVPILMTPTVRWVFNADGTLVNAVAPFADQTRKVAAGMDVPLIDMNARTKDLVERMGPEVALSTLAQLPPGAEARSTRAEAGQTTPDGPRHGFTLKHDNVHLGAEGAAIFARLVAYDLAALVPELRSRLAP